MGFRLVHFFTNVYASDIVRERNAVLTW